MAERTYAAIDGVPCRVLVDTPGERGYEPVGQQGRAASGAWRSSVFQWKRRWDVVASLQSIGDRDRLIAKLTSGGSLDCEGEAFGDSAAASPTHSRSSTARYKDSQGVLQEAASGVLRDKHWVENADGVLVPSYLLEGGKSNLASDPEDLSGASWSGSATVTTDDAEAPDGNTTADQLEDDDGAVGEFRRQDVTVSDDSGGDTTSIFVRKDPAATSAVILRLEFTGGSTALDYRIAVDPSDGTHSVAGDSPDTPDRLDVWDYNDDHWRVWISGSNNGSGNTTARITVYPAGRGDVSATGVVASETGTAHFWGLQHENGGFPTSYTGTTNRADDFLQYPVNFSPRTIEEAGGATFYTRWQELGTAFSGSSTRLWHIGGASAGDNPRMGIIGAGTDGALSGLFDDGSTSASSTTSGVLSLMDIGEARLVVFQESGDWKVQLHISVNGGAETSASAATIGSSLPESWSADTLTLGAGPGGSLEGFAAFIGLLRATTGERSMGHMRSLETPDLFPGPTVGKVSAYCPEFRGTTPTQVAGGLRHEVRFTLEEA